MSSHMLFVEILKVLLSAAFLFLFFMLYKRAILIGKSANKLLLANYNLEEHYQKTIIKKLLIKFIVVFSFEEEEMERIISKLSSSPEFIKNTKNQNNPNSYE
jgi:hypothetical protein